MFPPGAELKVLSEKYMGCANFISGVCHSVLCQSGSHLGVLESVDNEWVRRKSHNGIVWSQKEHNLNKDIVLENEVHFSSLFQSPNTLLCLPGTL